MNKFVTIIMICFMAVLMPTAVQGQNPTQIEQQLQKDVEHFGTKLENRTKKFSKKIETRTERFKKRQWRRTQRFANRARKKVLRSIKH